MKTINIRESLIKFDRQTDFKYTLTDLYEACRLDDKKKNRLVQYIDGKDIEGMSKMLSNEANVMTENVGDDISDEEIKEILGEEILDEGREWFDRPGAFPCDEENLSSAIDATMHSGNLSYGRFTDNHLVTYMRDDKYEVKHKVNGERVRVEFDTSNPCDSTLKFTVDGTPFVANYPSEAQDIIISELEKKNWSQFDVVVDNFEDDNVDGELLTEGPGAVLGDLAGKAVGDAWKGIKNFAKGVKDTAKDVAKTTKAVAKTAARDVKQSRTGAKVRDAARAVKGADNWDEFKNDYQRRQDARKPSDKVRNRTFDGKLGKSIGDVQDWKFQVNGKKLSYDQWMKLSKEERTKLIKTNAVKAFDLNGRETSLVPQGSKLSGLKEHLIIEKVGPTHPEEEIISATLMNVPGTTKVEFDWTGAELYKKPENHLIMLVFTNNEFGDGAEWFDNRYTWKRSVLAELRKMGWTLEDPLEDDDTYLYLVMQKTSIKENHRRVSSNKLSLNEAILSEMKESTDEEEDKPFTHAQIFDELKRETANFSIGTDRGIYSFEKEVKMAEKILKKHYENVKVTERGNDFMVEFSNPKNKKKKVNESKSVVDFVDEIEANKNNPEKCDAIYREAKKTLGKYDMNYVTDVYSKHRNAESKSLTESKGRFELEIWVPGSGGDDRERFIMASNNLQDIIDKAYEIDLDGDEAFYLRDMKDIYPYDLDQCYDAEELEDAIYNEWHYEPSADLRKQLGKALLPQREAYVENPREFANAERPKYITHWTQAYSEFEKAIKDIDIQDTAAIEAAVESLYNEHRGEFAWDQAWIRWLEPADTENYPSEDDANKAVSRWESEKKRVGGYGATYKRGTINEAVGMTADEPTMNEIRSRVPDYLDNHPYSSNMDVEDICEEVAANLFDLDYHEMSGDASYEIFNIVSRYVDSLDEAFELTADEMKAKHGTDNPDIINAGKPEEERVALKEQMTYTDTNGFLGNPGETYTMSQFRRMWQDKDTDPVMSGYDSFEEWVGETISQMDAHEDDVAPSGRGMASCKIWKDTNGIMGNPGEEYTLNDLADYWTNNNGSDPVLAEYKGDWKAWLDATIPQMEERIDSCLYSEGYTNNKSLLGKKVVGHDIFNDPAGYEKVGTVVFEDPDDRWPGGGHTIEVKYGSRHFYTRKICSNWVYVLDEESLTEATEESSKEWEYTFKDGAKGRVRKANSDHTGRKELSREEAQEIADYRGYKDGKLEPVNEESYKNMKESYEIKNVRGHFEVYKDGKFVCSADTKKEAEEEIKEMEGK